MVEALGINYIKKSDIVTAIGGDTLNIIGAAIIKLQFEEIELYVRFQVLESCALPIILGLDICQILNVVIDYENEIVKMKTDEYEVELQIFNKIGIISQDLLENENYLEVDEYNENDFEKNHIFYGLINADLSDAGDAPKTDKE
ncbi:hypothetical protein AYI70_g9380, partial [Smittium culicis]